MAESAEAKILRGDIIPFADQNQHSLLMGRFSISEQLGEGRFSSVFRAVDLLMKREVAIKLFKPTLARTPKELETFQKQARIACKLHHENVARVYSAEVSNTESPMIVMELLIGQSLADLLKTRSLTGNECARIFAQLSLGLAHIHGKGIAHGDLNPSNVILLKDSDSRLKIIDFGSASILQDKAESETRRYEGQSSATSALPLSAAYLSPEQCRGEKADERSDIYSVGCMLYESLCGRKAFAAGSNREIMQKQQYEYPPVPQSFWSDFQDCARYQDIALRCLQKDKSKRFQSAADLHACLIDNSIDPIKTAPGQLSSWAPPTESKKKKTVKANFALAAIGAFFCICLILHSEKILLGTFHGLQGDFVVANQERLAEILEHLYPPLSTKLYEDLLSYRSTKVDYQKRAHILDCLVDNYIRENERGKALQLVNKSLNCQESEGDSTAYFKNLVTLIDKIANGKEAQNEELLVRCRLLEHMTGDSQLYTRFLRRELDLTLERSRRGLLVRMWASKDKEDIAVLAKLVIATKSVMSKLPAPTNAMEDFCIEQICSCSRICPDNSLSKKAAELASLHIERCREHTTVEKQQIAVILNLKDFHVNDAYEQCIKYLSERSPNIQHRFKLLLLAGNLAVKLGKKSDAANFAAEARQFLSGNLLEHYAKFRLGVSLCLLDFDIEKLKGAKKCGLGVRQFLVQLLSEIPYVEKSERSRDGFLEDDWANDARNHEAFRDAADLFIESGDYANAEFALERYLEILEEFAVRKHINTTLPARWLEKHDLTPSCASLIKKIQSRIQ